MKDGRFKILSAIFLIIIITLSSILWLSLNQAKDLENKNNSLQNKVNSLQDKVDLLQTLSLEDFRLNGYDNPGGVTWNYKFIIKVLNNGTNDVDNITVTFNILSVNDANRSIDIYDPLQGYILVKFGLTMGEPYSIGNVKQGETKEVYGYINNNLLDSAKLRGSAFTVTLMQEDIVLDQATISI